MSEQSADSEGAPVFRVVIAYENLERGLEAMEIYERLIVDFAQECRFHLDIWKCEVLEIHPVREQAAKAAAVADLVLLSLEGDHELSADLQTWIEEWAGRRQETDGALVALVNPGRDDWPTMPSILGWLRETAVRGKMQFLTNSGESRRPLRASRWAAPLRHPAKNPKPSLEALLHSRMPRARWGLTE